jgi:multidrug efflux pump subunit AcrA (membrane-fusion protein)
MKKTVIILVIVVLVIIGSIVIISNFIASKSNELANVVSAQRESLTEIVSVTGKITAKDSVSLAFERSGRVNKVYVSEGDRVEVGQRLIDLDQSELSAQLRDAQASLGAETASLNQLKAGTRPEEIAVKNAEFNKAQQDLASYYAGVPDSLNDAFIKATDAVISRTDQLFTDENTQNPKVSFTVSDSAINNDMRSMRLLAGSELDAWKDELKGISVGSKPSVIDEALKNAQRRLSLVDDLLKKSLEGIDGSVGLSAALIQSYRSDINVGRTNVNLTTTNINTSEQTIIAQKLIVDRVKQELNLELAGPTKEQVNGQAARVSQAEAKVELIQAQMQKTSLKSPLKGVVTSQDAKVGEIATANNPVVSIMSEDNLEVDANVPEVDIAKVKVDNTAKITLDAYGSGIFFDAKVASMDPAETIIEGVSTYKTTLRFINKDERVKSGMTANVDILTGQRDNVVVIPQRLVVTKGSEKFVTVVLTGNKTVERKVETGLRGSDGNVEIVSGLNEGEKVLTIIAK